MVITFRDFKLIQFPAFLLKSGNWDMQDGLLFCDGKLLDDTNQEGATLGARRMQTHFKDKYELKNAVTAANGILKQKTPYFIDNKGKTFIYEKTRYLSLKYHKITKVVRKNVASLVWVKGHNAAFTVARPPDANMQWAGILHLHGVPWMLYEYSETKLKDTRRKV